MTAPWKHARRQAELARRQRDEALAQLQQKPEPKTAPTYSVPPVLSPAVISSLEAIMKMATEALAMPIMSKEMAFQAHVEETIAQRYQGWQLVELCWDPATHHVRVVVRCPHGQHGAMRSLGLDMVPPVEVADMLLDTLRVRCEQDHQHHQQLPKPSPMLPPYAMDPYIVLSVTPPVIDASSSSMLAELRKVFPGLNRMVEPPYGGRPDIVERIIVSLNDGHGWSRQQIADWLDTLHEPGLTAQPVSQGD